MRLQRCVLTLNSQVLYIIQELSLQVFVNDGLPSTICKTCLTKLEQALDLRKQIIESDAKLRKDLQLKTLKEDQHWTSHDVGHLSDSTDNEVQKPASKTKRKGAQKKIAVKRARAEKQPLSCKECKKTFKNQYYFEVHNTRHTGYMPYTCEVCNKGFSMRWVLNIHSRVHTGAKPYSCDICGKLFRFASALPNHMRIHTGIRPYKCDVCAKSFTQIGGLKVHQRTHTGEKPYICEICSKCFGEFASLNRHRRTHGNERNYPCPTCGKLFSDPSQVQRHLKTHTGEKPYSCELCDKRFTARGSLKVCKFVLMLIVQKGMTVKLKLESKSEKRPWGKLNTVIRTLRNTIRPHMEPRGTPHSIYHTSSTFEQLMQLFI